MNNRKFQIGSSKRRYRKSVSLSGNRISSRSSLAGLSIGVRVTFRWLSKFNWINLLKVIKMVVEIAEKIRSLIFCKLPTISYRYVGY